MLLKYMFCDTKQTIQVADWVINKCLEARWPTCNSWHFSYPWSTPTRSVYPQADRYTLEKRGYTETLFENLKVRGIFINFQSHV